MTKSLLAMKSETFLVCPLIWFLCVPSYGFQDNSLTAQSPSGFQRESRGLFSVLSDLKLRKKSDFVEDAGGPMIPSQRRSSSNDEIFQAEILSNLEEPKKAEEDVLFPIGVSQSLNQFHAPKNPNFEMLLDKVRPIFLTEKQEQAVLTPQDEANPEQNFHKNVLRMMKNGLEHEPVGADAKKSEQMTDLKFRVETVLEDIESGKVTKPDDLSKIVSIFNELMDKDAQAMKNRMDLKLPQMRAPFCSPGDDCFEDVDHEALDLEVKRLGKSMANYLKSRANEETNQASSPLGEDRVKFKTDAVLTETATVVAKLHRAILRNWHHILMVLHSLAGDVERTKNAVLRQGKSQDMTLTPAAKPLEDIEEFECHLEIPGLALTEAVTTKCLEEGIWHTDDICVSPIQDPVQECAPHQLHDNFVQVHGQHLFTIGQSGTWDIHVDVTAMPEIGDHLAHFEQVIGSVSKLPKGSDDEATPLFKIGHAVKFTEDHGNGHKTHVETGVKADLAVGDRLMLRIGKTRDKLQIRYFGKLVNRHVVESQTQSSVPKFESTYRTLQKFASSKKLAEIENKRNVMRFGPKWTEDGSLETATSTQETSSGERDATLASDGDESTSSGMDETLETTTEYMAYNDTLSHEAMEDEYSEEIGSDSYDY